MMAGEERPSPSSSTIVSGSVTESVHPPPSQDLDVAVVGSPGRDWPDVPLPIPKEDHDQERGENQDHAYEQPDTTAVLSEDLKHRIIKQVEYYFSDENLPTDKHLMGLIKKNKEGFVPIAVIAAFRRMKKLTQDHSFITAALRESSVLVVSPNGKKVKRGHPILLPQIRDRKLFTILVENLPEDHSEENIRQIFGEAGSIRSITICDPNVVDKSGKNNKADVLISNKLHALVEYGTLEAADKAVATLNDEQDWRNGMRVKLLKHLSKHGQTQRKQHWRGADSEKNGTGRASDQVGDQDAQNISEHHDDVPDEEEGDHQTKDKHGHKGRNQGRTRRPKYKGSNGMGMGHGTTSSAHTIEQSKPPPGPKMPDGTRGFAMGRGRPASNLPTELTM